MIINKSSAWVALGLLGLASYWRGAETRFRVGLALAGVLVVSIYAGASVKPLDACRGSRPTRERPRRASRKYNRQADYAMSYVFVIDTKVPNPAERSRFILKAVLTVPLLLALAAHLKELGFLTQDKKDQ